MFEMHGEVDLERATGYEAAIRKWLASGGPPVLDMTGVTFIDSSGLNMLARLNEQHGQPLTLQGLKPTIVKLLHLTGLDALFAIAP
jgi:anti-anti-sigma factor